MNDHKQYTEYIQKALYNLRKNDVFLCGLIQELQIIIENNPGPGAYIGYDKQRRKFIMGFNTSSLDKWTNIQRVDVLKHEIMHFINKHLFRFSNLDNGNDEDKKLYNIAADMSINQYLPNIPYGCNDCKDKDFKYKCENKKCPGKTINIKDWKNKKGKPLDKLKTFEYYYEEIKESLKEEHKKEDPNSGKKLGPNDEIMKNFKSHDEHIWDSLSDEEKQQMLSEAKNLIKRTMEKTSFSHDMIPGSINDFMDEIDSELNKIGAKDILRRAIKKTVSMSDRESTWKRPNKRFGNVAPGSTIGKIPNINSYVDTSGSISTKELNDMLSILDEFMKVGNKKLNLGLWHTELYSFNKRRLLEKFDGKLVQSGGTDVGPVIEHIAKIRGDLNIILTDGYFSRTVDLKLPKDCEIIWVITKDGNDSHPYLDIGKTIKMKDLVD